MSSIAAVVLNWNGAEDSLRCINALKQQTLSCKIIAVDNGSTDDFAASIKKDSSVVLIENSKNLGFAGGVNTGIRYALKNNFEWIALINNDALPEKTWLEELYEIGKHDKDIGIVTGKLIRTNGLLDSTGDQYSTWGLPHPRGRDQKDIGQYQNVQKVFGASGGASLYRSTMLADVGLFDEDFFAYYEDVDISFRARLRNWEVVYQPQAIAHHKVGATSSKIKGFTVYMAVKNLPWLLIKNVPLRLLPTIFPRFLLSYSSIVLPNIARGHYIPVVRGVLICTLYLPKKMIQRILLQRRRTISNNNIKEHLLYDLPPNARTLRKFRKTIRKTLINRS